jgi:hypothetical protein
MTQSVGVECLAARTHSSVSLRHKQLHLGQNLRRSSKDFWGLEVEGGSCIDTSDQDANYSTVMVWHLRLFPGFIDLHMHKHVAFSLMCVCVSSASVVGRLTSGAVRELQHLCFFSASTIETWKPQSASLLRGALCAGWFRR